MNKSIQRQLSSGLTLAVLLASVITGALSFGVAFNRASQQQVDTLCELANLVDGDDFDKKGWMQVTAGQMQENGSVVVTRLPALPGNPALEPGASLPPGLSEFHSRGLDWRVFVRRDDDGVLVAAAQKRRGMAAVAVQSALLTILPLLLLMPVLTMVSRHMVRRGMAPLHALATRLQQVREGRDLDGLPETDVPQEIRPFILSLNNLLLRLRQQSEEQRRFVTDAAHELRSPLAALSLQADNLARADGPDQMQQRLTALRSGVRRASQMTSQLLDLARQQSFVAAAERLGVREIAGLVIDQLLPLAEQRGIVIELAIDAAADILVPAEPFAMLLRNAVENSCKYSPEGSRVQVRLRVVGEQLWLEVLDRGPGIPEAELEKVFEPFYRLDRGQVAGSGLGLSIVRDAARRLGGQVTLQNRQDGAGLQFSYCQTMGI